MHEIKRYAQTLWHWRWLIAVTTLAATVAGYMGESQTQRLYRSTATVSVGEVTQRSNVQAGDFTISQSLAERYALVAGLYPFSLAVREQLPPELQAGPVQLSVTAQTNTSLLRVVAQDSDPRRAMAVADLAARQLLQMGPNVQDDTSETNRQFILQQLASWRARIQDGEVQLKELDNRLLTETSARAAQDIQNQSAALKARISTWETTYATLLEQSQGGRNSLRLLEAATPAVPVGATIPINVPIAGVIGLLLGSGAALLLSTLDDTIRTADRARALLGQPVLATIPRERKSSKTAADVSLVRETSSLLGEAYRLLYSNIEFRGPEGLPRCLLVTSAGAEEGKTTTACNLAVAIAQAGRRVILCDGNLRQPKIAQLFGLTNYVGLSTLLLDRTMPLDVALMATSVEGLKVVVSGLSSTQPGELLSQMSLRERLDEMVAASDVVIVDAPAVLTAADAVALGALTKRAVLVVDAQRTRAVHAQTAKAMLEQVGVTLLGTALVKVADGQAPEFPFYHSGRKQQRTAHGGPGAPAPRGGWVSKPIAGISLQWKDAVVAAVPWQRWNGMTTHLRRLLRS